MKRFTESAKWRDPWFRKLSPEAKLAFLYVLDAVDNAGVWEPDYDLADFQIGEKVNWLGVIQEFGDRLHILKSGKWLLTRFIGFQFGELRPDCKPHQQVLRLIEQHQIGTLMEGYLKGIYTPKDKDKDKEKDKDTEKDKDRTAPAPAQSPGSPPAISPESIYAEYPRKEARSDALRAIGKALKVTSAEWLLSRTKAYAAAVRAWPPEERQFVPHPATWFNGARYEDDPAMWQSRAAPPAQPQEPQRVPDNLKGVAVFAL